MLTRRSVCMPVLRTEEYTVCFAPLPKNRKHVSAIKMMCRRPRFITGLPEQLRCNEGCSWKTRTLQSRGPKLKGSGLPTAAFITAKLFREAGDESRTAAHHLYRAYMFSILGQRRKTDCVFLCP